MEKVKRSTSNMLQKLCSNYVNVNSLNAAYRELLGTIFNLVTDVCNAKINLLNLS